MQYSKNKNIEISFRIKEDALKSCVEKIRKCQQRR